MSTPCYDCGTSEGVATRHGNPRRYNGLPYGVPGQLCDTCRNRRRRALDGSPNLCDLCGQNPEGGRYDGAEFDLEGRICGECRDELRDEQRLARYRRLSETPVRHGEHGASGFANGWLPVLNHRFTAKDLTPRAACRLMVLEAKRRSA